MLHALNKIYVGSEWGYNGSQQPVAKIRVAIDVARAKVAGGADMERSAGLAILLEVSPGDAATAAEAVGNDPKISDGLREDALRVRLLAQPAEGEDTAVPIALAAMDDRAHPSLRKVGLSYLASGGSAITELRGDTSLYVSSIRSYSYTVGHGQPILVKPPVGLTAGPLREVLATPGADADQAGYAGYLLVLLGDPSGMDPLMAAARAHSLESPWNQLVYRAVAKNEDGARVPVLTEIYESMLKRNKYELREFYWTIRPHDRAGDPQAPQARPRRVRDGQPEMNVVRESTRIDAKGENAGRTKNCPRGEAKGTRREDRVECRPFFAFLRVTSRIDFLFAQIRVDSRTTLQ